MFVLFCFQAVQFARLGWFFRSGDFFLVFRRKRRRRLIHLSDADVENAPPFEGIHGLNEPQDAVRDAGFDLSEEDVIVSVCVP